MQILPDSVLAANATDVTGQIESILTSAAIIAGGLWAYFKYFRGRTFHERLAISVEGVIEQQKDDYFLLVVTTVANVGLSKVPISQEGSGLEILTCISNSPDLEKAEFVDWRSVATVPVLEGHEWIEPGETVHDQQLFLLPEGCKVAVKSALQVASKKQQWVTAAIITINSEKTQRQENG